MKLAGGLLESERRSGHADGLAVAVALVDWVDAAVNQLAHGERLIACFGYQRLRIGADKERPSAGVGEGMKGLKKVGESRKRPSRCSCNRPGRASL
ncbi:hypothetical protein D3C81_1565700 [compost metagenome]